MATALLKLSMKFPGRPGQNPPAVLWQAKEYQANSTTGVFSKPYTYVYIYTLKSLRKKALTKPNICLRRIQKLKRVLTVPSAMCR